MSLPRADYDPRRVCVNPCPNFTPGLGKHKRTVGVYLAGALVRLPPIRKRIATPKLILCLTSAPFLMHMPMGGLAERILQLSSCGIAYVRPRVCSSPSPIGLSSTPRSSLRTLNPHTRRNRFWCTSRLSTGYPEFALSSECSSST